MASALTRITSIGRPVEAKYPTNRAILIIMGVAAVAAAVQALVGGAELGPSAYAAGHAALLVFIVWAYGRETAPDDNPAAFIAVAAVVGAWGYGLRPDVLPLAALMGGSRIVNRTVGPPPALLDMVAVTAIAGWVTWQGNWPVGIAVALAMLLDFRLKPRHLVAMPFAMALAFVTVAAWRVTRPVFGPPTSTVGWVAVGIAAAFAVVVLAQGRLTSRTDRDDEELSPARVQGGMAVALLAAVAMAGRGQEHLLAATGLFCVMAGTVFGRPRLWLRPRAGS